MIPPAITRQHVLAAIAEIDRDGVPHRRGSRGYVLMHGGKAYPPKYVVAVAARIATGRELRPDEHTGGNETNGFLRRLGFAIQVGSTS